MANSYGLASSFRKHKQTKPIHYTLDLIGNPTLHNIWILDQSDNANFTGPGFLNDSDEGDFVVLGFFF